MVGRRRKVSLHALGWILANAPMFRYKGISHICLQVRFARYALWRGKRGYFYPYRLTHYRLRAKVTY